VPRGFGTVVGQRAEGRRKKIVEELGVMEL